MGFIKWHKRILEKYKTILIISDYQLMWIAWFKGILLGLIIAYFLLK